MKEYQVGIMEVLQKIVYVSADTEEEAIEKVKRQYDDEEIVLDSADFVDVTIEIFHEET